MCATVVLRSRGAGGFACLARCVDHVAIPPAPSAQAPGRRLGVRHLAAVRLAAPARLDRAGPSGSGRAWVTLDRQADQATRGPLWRKDPRMAAVVAEVLRAGQPERDFYVLRAWVVMPNHVPVLLRPVRPLAVITRWLKGATARSANLVLGRTGQPFWQDESWDRWVRSEQELHKVARYVEHHPVAAG